MRLFFNRKGGSEAGKASFAERRVRDGLGSWSGHGRIMLGIVPPLWLDFSLLFLEVQISWQAQHFVNLHVQISWQAQPFCEPPCADFVGGTALCEPPCADFVAGTALL